MDVDNSGTIDFDEFLTLMIKYVKLGGKQKIAEMRVGDDKGASLQSSLMPNGHSNGIGGAPLAAVKVAEVIEWYIKLFLGVHFAAKWVSVH